MKFQQPSWKALCLLVCTVVGLSITSTTQAQTSGKPWDTSFIDFETGYLWKNGGSSILDYEMVPVMLGWRSKEVFGHDFANGSRLFVRNRVALLGEFIAEGPENHYFGLMGAPSFEWSTPTGSWSVFTGIGGGAGWLDSQGVVGGQGQDFTLNWFVTAGVAHAITDTVQLRISGMFQHLSNGGATDPNPGVNAMGVTVGLSWGF